MTNYFMKFAPNLSIVTALMIDLLKKDSEFVWDMQQETAFTKIKDIVTRSPVLAFYNPKELTLQVDASEKATSATLMLEGQQIEYMSTLLLSNTTVLYLMSRALDKSKQNWATIKREMYMVASNSDNTCTDGRQL